MKKRIISLLLVLCLICTMLPSLSVESDAAIGSILKIGFKLCKSVVKGTIVTCKNASYYKGNVGKAVLGQFKNIGADLTGLDIGENYGDGEGDGEQQPTQDAITAAAFEEIKQSMQVISSKLDETNNAIYQLESTVSSGVQQLSNQLSDLYNEINKLGGTVTNATQLNRYYTYLTEFFTFFNQYYEGISYYDEQLAYAMQGNRSETYVKNLFDQFYHLENVEYTGNLHSAVTKLGKYIRGEYVSADGGSVVDVLSRYYIQAYKLVHTGCTEAEARAASATAIEDMVGYIYYAYCTGVYYEDAVLMYQSSYMERAGVEEYTTDFGTCISVEQVDDRYLSVSEDALRTAGALLGSLLENYPDGKLETPYFAPLGAQYAMSYGITRRLSLDGFSMYGYWGEQIAYLPDIATGLSDYFSDDLKDAFSGITTYSLEGGDQVEGGLLTLCDGNRLQTGSGYGTVNLLVRVLDETIVTIPVTAQDAQMIGSTPVVGEGTEDFPWIIKTPIELSIMRDAPNDHYLLACDISLNNNWDSFDFGGVLDGNGHAISNIHTSNGGLFNTLTGTVRNLTVKNFSVNLNVSVPGGHATAYAGAIAGTVTGNGLIFRCRAMDGSVSASANSPAFNGFSGASFSYAGGIAGYVTENATIRSCAVEDVKLKTTEATNGQGVGGIVGNLFGGTVSDCFVNVDDPNVTFESNMVGGIVGSAEDKFTIHDAVIALKSNPFKGGLSGLVMGYSVNGSMEGGYQGVEVSGKFMLIDRSAGEDWCGGQPTYTLSWYGGAQSEIDRDTNNNLFTKDAFTANCSIRSWVVTWVTVDFDEMTSKFNGPDTSFLDEFVNYYLDFEKRDSNGARIGDGTLDFKPLASNVEQLEIKTDYESGQCFNASGWRLFYSDETGTYSWPAGGFSFSITGQNYHGDPLTEDTEVTFTIGGITKTYDLHVTRRHTWVEMVVTAPTCTEAGESMMLCVDCGATKDTKTLPALGHKPVIDPAVSPSCKGDGLSEGSHCGYCGEVLTEQQIIAATDDHGHTIVKGYPATCTTPGLTDQDWCEGCGLVHQAATVIPATGHTMKTYTVLEATCTAGGMIQQKCETCGAYGDFTSVAPLGHDYATTVIAPTHTEVGYTVYLCRTCGDTWRGDYVAPIGHSFGAGTVTKEPTCTQEGEMTYACSCGNSHSVSVPRVEHEMIDTVTAPTCQEMGFTTHSCKHCGYQYIDSYTAPVAHTLQSTVTVPTCTAFGFTTHSCEHCDYQYIDGYTAPVSHSIRRVVTAPTCTAFGYTTCACRNCAYSYVEAYTAPTGHTFDHAGATCTQQATCTACGAVSTDHNTRNHAGTAQWIQTEKHHILRYSCCGADEIAKEAHNWHDGVCADCGYACAHTGGTATCSEQALCAICGLHYGQTDPANHAVLDHIAERDATEEAEGNVEHWICEGCGKFFADRQAVNEISAEQSVTARLARDYSELILWLVLLLMNTATIVILVVVLTSRKKATQKA